MDTKKRLNSASGDKRTPDKGKTKIITKSNSLEEKRIKENPMKDGVVLKEKYHKPSMIPVMKVEKTETRCTLQKHRHSSYSKISCCTTAEKRYEDFEQKLKLLDEKEKSIADYYLKIEKMIKKFLSQKNQKDSERLSKCKTAQSSAARKMTSEPSVFGRTKFKTDMLLDFESNVQQISDIWLKTSVDLSNALKNLKKKASFDSVEFEIENVRIQLAIKQAKSLTLIKTRNVIAEAKKLFYNREIIRTELEKLLSNENIKLKCGRCKSLEHALEERKPRITPEVVDKQGNGDSRESDEEVKESTCPESCNNDIESVEQSGEDHSSEEEKENTSVEVMEPSTDPTNTSQIVQEIEVWAKELAKKNETITNLNNKVFELQKTCNEHAHKYNLLQFKLYEFHEKIQWNHVLWKQIGKLKEQIKSLQQSNKLLESQKRELECKISKLDQELDRLIKLNHVLNQKKCLLNVQEYRTTATECRGGECRRGEDFYDKTSNDFDGIDERVLEEKQNAINHLKTILNVMKNQEDYAQKQISMFQSKIEELEKNTKA